MHALLLDRLRTGQIFNPEKAPGVALGVDQLSVADVPHRVGDATPSALARAWDYLGWALGAVGIAGLGWAALRRGGRSVPVAVVTALMLLALVARVGLLGVLDASSWNGVQSRYLLPGVPGFVVFGVLGLWLLLPMRRAK
jgi:hypothetical protein